MNVEKDVASSKLRDSNFLSKIKALCRVLCSTLTREDNFLLRSFYAIKVRVIMCWRGGLLRVFFPKGVWFWWGILLGD